MREASRTLRRYPGGAVVSVTLRGRSYGEVVDDMIDGVLAANRVGPDSRAAPAPGLPARARRRAAEPEIDLPALEQAEKAEEQPPAPTLTPVARVAERQTQAA